jgi:hypothetical protein
MLVNTPNLLSPRWTNFFTVTLRVYIEGVPFRNGGHESSELSVSSYLVISFFARRLTYSQAR